MCILMFETRSMTFGPWLRPLSWCSCGHPCFPPQLTQHSSKKEPSHRSSKSYRYQVPSFHGFPSGLEKKTPSPHHAQRGLHEPDGSHCPSPCHCTSAPADLSWILSVILHTPVLGTFPIKNDFKLKILYSISNFFF